MYVVFRPTKQELEYHIDIETYNKESKVVNNILSYDYSIKQKKETLNGYIINFKRSNVLLNKTNEQPLMIEIALILGEALFNLDIEISIYGEILKIKNLKEIHEEWELIKYKVLNTYLGETVELIVKDMDKKILDMDMFISLLYRDSFFYFFLRPYTNYAKKDKVRFIDKLYNIGGVQELTPIYSSKLIETEEKKKQITGEAILDQKSFNRIKTKQECDLINFKMSYCYNFTSEDYLKNMQCKQELLVDEKLSQGFKIDVNLIQKL